MEVIKYKIIFKIFLIIILVVITYGYVARYIYAFSDFKVGDIHSTVPFYSSAFNSFPRTHSKKKYIFTCHAEYQIVSKQFSEQINFKSL